MLTGKWLDCCLAGADLTGTELVNADFSGADLTGARLVSAGRVSMCSLVVLRLFSKSLIDLQYC